MLVLPEPLLGELVPPYLLNGQTPLGFRRQHQRIDPRAQALVALLRHTLDNHAIEPLEAESLSLTLVCRSLGPRTSHEPHDLRHHFASRLVQLGVPLKTVRDLLGHSSMAMSLRYAHLAPDQRREAVTKLAAKRAGAATHHPQWDFDPNAEPRTD